MLTRRDFLKTALLTTGVATLPASTGLVFPYIQNLRRRRASIVWKSLVASQGAVEFSQDSSFSSNVAARLRELLPDETGLSYPIYLYQADLIDLTASTDYYYRVLMDGMHVTFGEGFRFRTAGPGGFNFLAFGDCGMGRREQYDLAQRMLKEDASLALLLGDLVYMSGSYAEYEVRYLDYYGDLMRRVPFFPTPGNHDYETQNAAPYLAMHSLPIEDVPPLDQGRYYSFDWSNVHFISLDTNASLREAATGTGKMLEWLERDLEKNTRFFRVVYFHHPPYATGPNERDPTVDLVREHIVPILERYNVRLVLSGHEHSYQRTHPIREGEVAESGRGTVYITSGGGGAYLYPVFESPRIAFSRSVHHYVRAEVQGARITLRAIAIDGQEIDRFTLAPPPVICSTSVAASDPQNEFGSGRPVVTIYGRHLASEESQATDLPLPRRLAGTRVTLHGRPLPLLSVSGSRIELQLTHWRQWADLRVETPNGWAETSVVFSGRLGARTCK